MKKDEPFNPSIKSSTTPDNLVFRLVTRDDREAISALMADRNPNLELSEIDSKTDREIVLVETSLTYRLYVAELNKKVVGFCRYYHTSALPDSKKVYPAPEGWYGMGIIVDPKLRRHGIARFLSSNRLNILKDQGASELYSIVDAKNLTSLRMHLEFGFEEVASAEGFLHVKLESGHGHLFRVLV